MRFARDDRGSRSFRAAPPKATDEDKQHGPQTQPKAGSVGETRVRATAAVRVGSCNDYSELGPRSRVHPATKSDRAEEVNRGGDRGWKNPRDQSRGTGKAREPACWSLESGGPRSRPSRRATGGGSRPQDAGRTPCGGAPGRLPSQIKPSRSRWSRRPDQLISQVVASRSSRSSALARS